MRFIVLILVTLVLTLLVTELNFLQRIFDTVSLTSRQWGICLVATVIAVVMVEASKLLLRRTGWASAAPELVEHEDARPQIPSGIHAMP